MLNQQNYRSLGCAECANGADLGFDFTMAFQPIVNIKTGEIFAHEAQLSTLAGFSSTNPSAQPNKWKAKRMIFAINNKGTDYFPVYALDPEKNHRPLKILTNILQVFSEKKDGWGAAYWFASVNGFLGGKRPQDILHSNPEAVLAAAKNEVTGIPHG